MTDSAVVDCPPQRGPGRPPGRGKTPGSGRQKGTPNKINREIHQIAGRYTLKALRQAWKLAQEAEQEMVRLKAIELLLSYGHGRPAQVQLIGGTGEPIQSQQLTVEISQRIASVFGQVGANGDKPVAETLDDDGLRAVSAVSFLAAQAEAANGHQLPAVPQPATRGEVIEVPPGDPPPRAPTEADVLSGHPDGPRTDEATQRAPTGQSVKTPIEVAPEPEAPDPGFTLSFVEHDYAIRGVEPSRANLPVTFELRKRGGLCRSGPFALVLGLMREQVGADLGEWVMQAPRVGVTFAGERPDQGPTQAGPPQVNRGHENRKRRHRRS